MRARGSLGKKVNGAVFLGGWGRGGGGREVETMLDTIGCIIHAIPENKCTQKWYWWLMTIHILITNAWINNLTVNIYKISEEHYILSLFKNGHTPKLFEINQIQFFPIILIQMLHQHSALILNLLSLMTVIGYQTNLFVCLNIIFIKTSIMISSTLKCLANRAKTKNIDKEI